MPITLGLTGDILPTRRLGETPAAVREVFDLLQAADLAIGNFEMPLTKGGAPLHKLLNIRAAPAIAADVPAFGVDVVTLANNHAVDYGWSGLCDTAAGLRNAGLAVIGLGSHRAAAMAPHLCSVGEQRVGIIAFSCLTPTGMAAAADRPGIAGLHVETGYQIDPWYQMEEPGDPAAVRIRTALRADDLAVALAEIEQLRPRCDVLVVSIHWGFGSGEALAEYQAPLARALIAAGADIVHGHHPHAVHAIGFVAGRPVLFSPGTFIGQQVFLPAGPAVQALWAGMSPDGYVARLTLDGGAPPEVALYPTTLDAERLPRRATGADFDRIADRLARLSAPHGAAVRRGDGVLYVTPI